MSTVTLAPAELTKDSAPAAEQPFDLDIAIIEIGEAADKMIQMTDDNCGSSCPNACVTAVA